MSVVFTNSPILETVCDFQFAPGPPWDWTVPGLLYERVRAIFPLKQEQRIVQIALPPTPDAETTPTPVAVSRLHFLREDKRALIQVGPNFLAINHLQPYPTWEPYKKMVFEHFDHYIEVAQPAGIQNIGLRYINRIEFPEPVELGAFPGGIYTKAVPGVPEELLNMPVSSFLQRVEIPSLNRRGVLVIQSGTEVSDVPQPVAIMLDLAFTASFDQFLPLEEAKDWIEQAHSEIEKAFLACITPQARQLFGETTHD